MKMNFRPALPTQTHSGNCYNDFKALAMPNPVEGFPRSPDAFIVPSSTEMDSNFGTSFNGFPTNQHFPSSSPRERHSPFISQSSGSIAHFDDDDLDNQLDVFTGYQEECNYDSWSNGQIQGLLDFPESMPLPNSHMENGAEVVFNDDHFKRIYGRELPEEEFYTDTMDPNWNGFIIDSNVRYQQPKAPPPSFEIVMSRPTIQQHHSFLSTQVSASANSTSTSQCNKSRMRWTQELHEAFVDAVNHFGGCEKATPKGVLMRMNVEGLTIYHVKSHLQKYRAARFRPESSEGSSKDKTCIIDQMSPIDLQTSITITEALRMQMKVQKQLHEQLEIQRKLQLRIEEQGRYLLQMIESQNKAEMHQLTSIPAKTHRPTSSVLKSDTMKHDRLQSQPGTSTSIQPVREISNRSKGKEKVLQSSNGADQHLEAEGSGPMKRARLGGSFL